MKRVATCAIVSCSNGVGGVCASALKSFQSASFAQIAATSKPSAASKSSRKVGVGARNKNRAPSASAKRSASDEPPLESANRRSKASNVANPKPPKRISAVGVVKRRAASTSEGSNSEKKAASGFGASLDGAGGASQPEKIGAKRRALGKRPNEKGDAEAKGATDGEKSEVRIVGEEKKEK